MIENKKFVEELMVTGYSVKTDTGFEPIIGTNKTIEYEVYSVKTKNHSLKCADTHILFDVNYNEIFVKDLKSGMVIITETGPEEVLECINTHDSENMFDLSVKSANKRYYTNGILSHNTTIAAFKSKRHYVVIQNEKRINCWKPLKSILLKQMSRDKMVQL